MIRRGRADQARRAARAAYQRSVNRRATLTRRNVGGDAGASCRHGGHDDRLAEMIRRAAAGLPLFDGDERAGEADVPEADWRRAP